MCCPQPLGKWWTSRQGCCRTRCTIKALTLLTRYVFAFMGPVQQASGGAACPIGWVMASTLLTRWLPTFPFTPCSQQVVDFVRQRLDKGVAPQDIASELLNSCLANDPREARGIGCDNMTAAVRSRCKLLRCGGWRVPLLVRAIGCDNATVAAVRNHKCFRCLAHTVGVLAATRSSCPCACQFLGDTFPTSARRPFLQIVVFEPSSGPARHGSCPCGAHSEEAELAQRAQHAPANGHAGSSGNGSDTTMREATPVPETAPPAAAAAAAKA